MEVEDGMGAKSESNIRAQYKGATRAKYERTQAQWLQYHRAVNGSNIKAQPRSTTSERHGCEMRANSGRNGRDLSERNGSAMGGIEGGQGILGPQCAPYVKPN